jgi:hypothetical protein
MFGLDGWLSDPGFVCFEVEYLYRRSSSASRRYALGLRSIFLLVLKQGPRHWAIGEAVAAAGAFSFENFVHVMDVLHFWMDGAFGTNLTAKAAGDAETFDDADFHNLLRST